MFLRVTKAKSRNYVVIVRGYRDANGKSKQKTVKNLGSFRTEEEKEKLYKIGHNLINHMEGKAIVTEDTTIEELNRKNWGADAVVDKLFDEFKLKEKIKEITKDRKIKFNLIDSLKFLIINRLLDPKSKLAAYHNKDFIEFGSKNSEISLHNLYRTLDELKNYKDEISKHIFEIQKSKTGEIDVVLFDVTTLYFESKKQDELRDFGFSKDCKFNEVQIVLSMMVTQDGRPLGYEVFSGNTYEGNTLLLALNDLKEKYNLKKVTIVADRGMSALKNLEEIKKAGFEYIVAFRVKNASKKLQSDILKEENYVTITENDESLLKYKILDNSKQNNDNLLCIYSSKRAQKDRKDRDKLIEKARLSLDNNTYKRRSGGLKYLEIEEYKAIGINKEKIIQDEKYDGYYAISYSNKDASPNEILSAYHDLWKIEESFRTMKHFLQTRPMFHWNPNRVIGHIILNFIALSFEKELEIKTGFSQNQLRKLIYAMQFSTVKIGGKKFQVRAPLNEDARLILDKLEIKYKH